MLDTHMYAIHIGAMKLDAYIRVTGVTEQELSDETGYSQSAINRLRNGEMNPTMKFLAAISKATNGAVTPNDFLPPFREAESAPLAPPREAPASEDVTGEAAA